MDSPGEYNLPAQVIWRTLMTRLYIGKLVRPTARLVNTTGQREQQELSYRKQIARQLHKH